MNVTITTYDCASYLCRMGLIPGSVDYIDVTGPVPRHIFVREIQEAVVRHYKLDAIDMASARRARRVARPRQVAMYLSKRLTKKSLPEIGRMFGGRDHSTVIHAVRRIEELRLTDPDLDADVRALMRELQQ